MKPPLSVELYWCPLADLLINLLKFSVCELIKTVVDMFRVIISRFIPDVWCERDAGCVGTDEETTAVLELVPQTNRNVTFDGNSIKTPPCIKSYRPHSTIYCCSGRMTFNWKKMMLHAAYVTEPTANICTAAEKHKCTFSGANF